MLRIKDPKKSLDYYKLLGLSQVNKLEFHENKFDLYLLGQYNCILDVSTRALTKGQLMTAQSQRRKELIGLIGRVSSN